MSAKNEVNSLLRSLPKVDECLLILLPYIEAHKISHYIAKKAVQTCINKVRNQVISGDTVFIPDTLDAWTELFVQQIEIDNRPNFRRVINGTGVVVHTNLGRSLLSEEAACQLVNGASYYSNLEFNLDTGKRGSRYSLVEEIICDLTGAEAAIVVNNNAGAVFIALESLTSGREVIVSRGQLVEIGGSFRIPDVMSKSGAHLVEVGATNRTHPYDYEKAITEQTSLLLKVHSSNFRIIGFTSEVSAEELVRIGKHHGIPVMEDLGSGSLIDMSQFGLPGEPTVQDVLRAGVDVVTFSGDKLLGGPQAGIIVGKKEYVDKIKKNPLNRALRIDKFTLASLEIILRSYYDLDKALQDIPTLRMIAEDSSSTRKRAKKFLRTFTKSTKPVCESRLIATQSKVGGGSLPEYSLESFAVELKPLECEVNTLERDFRSLTIPVIGRIEKNRFLLDFRTIQDSEVSELSDLLSDYFNS